MCFIPRVEGISGTMVIRCMRDCEIPTKIGEVECQPCLATLFPNLCLGAGVLVETHMANSMEMGLEPGGRQGLWVPGRSSWTLAEGTGQGDALQDV